MSRFFRQATFVKSITRLAQAPPERPSVVFSGRSNVGKSSLINRLLGRKSLARTSSKPGHTRQINFYDVDDAIYFVDLPGYGYARAPKDEQRQWGAMIEGFLRGFDAIGLVIVIVDVRRDLRDEERHLIQWLNAHGLAWRLVVTKCDKLSRSAAQRRLTALRAQGPSMPLPPLTVSAQTGAGMAALAAEIHKALESPPREKAPRCAESK